MKVEVDEAVALPNGSVEQHPLIDSGMDERAAIGRLIGQVVLLDSVVDVDVVGGQYGKVERHQTVASMASEERIVIDAADEQRTYAEGVGLVVAGCVGQRYGVAIIDCKKECYRTIASVLVWCGVVLLA